MNKVKKNFRMYEKYAYKNVINDLISEVLQLENFREYTPDTDTFGDGWNTCIERILKLLSDVKK